MRGQIGVESTINQVAKKTINNHGGRKFKISPEEKNKIIFGSEKSSCKLGH